MPSESEQDLPENVFDDEHGRGWYVVHATITVTEDDGPRDRSHKQVGTHEVDEGVVAYSEREARYAGRHHIARKYGVPVGRVRVTSVERTQ